MHGNVLEVGAGIGSFTKLYENDYENILLSETGDFYLLDWRQDFGGNTEYGDLYYDLAKLDHALLLSGKIVRKNLYGCDIKDKDIKINYKFFIFVGSKKKPHAHFWDSKKIEYYIYF